jgi:hypothetical protein
MHEQIVWGEDQRRMLSAHPSRFFKLALQEQRGRRSGGGTPVEFPARRNPGLRDHRPDSRNRRWGTRKSERTRRDPSLRRTCSAQDDRQKQTTRRKAAELRGRREALRYKCVHRMSADMALEKAGGVKPPLQRQDATICCRPRNISRRRDSSSRARDSRQHPDNDDRAGFRHAP